MRHRRLFLCAAIALTIVPGLSRAQTATRWVVAGDVTSDLWFHSLAAIGLSGPGALPFYDSAYVLTVSEAKRARALPPTQLDRQAQRLRSALMSDRAFEVLHFLPLYLDRITPAALSDLLRRAADQQYKEQTGLVAALGQQLGTTSQRALLQDLADAIEDEWTSYVAQSFASRGAADAARRRQLQARWDERFAPRLAAVFRALNISRGVLLVSPALGPEGRIVDLGTAGTIVAVSTWSGSGVRDAPLLAAVRELCFPLLKPTRLTQPNAALASSAGENSRAAVQCGAMLIDSLMPEAAGDYRSLFLSPRASEPATAYRRRFDERFRVEPATIRVLSEIVARVVARSAGALP